MSPDKKAILALTADNERLRGLLREARHVLLNWKAGNIEGPETNRVLARIDDALAGAAVQPNGATDKGRQ